MNPTHHKNMNPTPATNNQQSNDHDQQHASRSLCSENENAEVAPVRGEASPRPTRIQLDAVRPTQIQQGNVSNGVPVAPRNNPGQALGEDGIRG